MLLLAVQIKREQQVRLIRVWAVEMVAPLGRVAAWTTDGVSGVWSNYVGPAPHAPAKTTSCSAELDRLKLRNAELEGRAAEADRLAHLLGFRETHARSAHAGGARDRRQPRRRQSRRSSSTAARAMACSATWA